MIKKHALLVLAFSFFSICNLFSQDVWTKSKEQSANFQDKKALYIKNFPTEYSLMNLNLDGFKNNLNARKNQSKQVIKLPNSKGELKRFSIKESSYLAPELAVKFPMIKSYSAQGIDDPTAVAKISIGTDGIHAIIFSGKKSTLYIDPYTKDKEQYLVYKRSNLGKNDFECLVEDSTEKVLNSSITKRNADDGKLRTYKIAIACSAEYSLFHLNRQSIPTTATDTEKKAAVLSAMNTSMTRINGVYERDLAVRMVIVGNNDKIIFLDSATDGITDTTGSAGTMIDEVQVICDREIGDANYDIGHLFSTKGSGLAQLRSVCQTGGKARGVTGRDNPVGDPYDIDYVSHELGHQFGATHTQNNDCNRTNSTAVEPGSASTIMGYAGICAPNVQSNSDDHFHAVSIAQMWAHVQGSGSCGTDTDTGNTAPTSNAGSDFSIPKSTPFVLRGEGNDAQGVSSLTYNWEQIDNEIASMPPVSTNSAGPMFRSLPSKDSPNRYMPALATVIAGNTSTTWEVLPSVARTMDFALTVRDNNAGGGNTARDDMKVTVTNADAFTVTAPTTAVTWNTGSSQTITWNKGTTDQAPINCAKVNIRLSTDGGVTFPIIIKENTINDGTETIVIPNNATTQARIMVEAADNIFYNVNSTNFTINSTVPTFLLTNKTDKQTVCNTSNNTVSYTLNFDFVNGFSETVTLSATGLPNGATASFSPNTINADGDVTMTINNLNGSNQQDYTIVAKGASTSVTQTTDALLKVLGTTFSNINIVSPANNATGISVSPKFEWGADANATSYTIVVATDAGFSNIVINETATTNSYIHSSPLSGTTKYFWYVKPKNDCGEGANSTTGEFTTEAPSYCSSTFTDEAGGTEHITNVTFNTINNNSGNDTTDGYEDFTSKSTNIKRTSTHQISVTFDTGGYQDHCYVFIDWNQDYQFNKTTERYDLGSKTADVDTATLNITVPQGAVLGKTRMRIIIEYDAPNGGYGDGPCDSDHKTEWGETEDYSVVIEEAPRPDFTLTNTTGSLSICNKAVSQVEYKLDYKALNGFSENVTFSSTNAPANSNITINPTSINSNGEVTVTVANLDNVAVGDYTIKLTGTGTSINKSVDLILSVNDNHCKSTGNTVSQISTTLVNFGTINNASTKTTGYSDFKSMKAEVQKGDKYTLKVNANTDGNKTVKTYAWIDWNQNCLFDAGEQYDLGETTNKNGATANSGLEITVPNSALAGSTTLRVSTKLASAGNPDSCELNFDGEVEDYTISITQSFSLINKTEALSICNKAINQVEYKLDYKTLNGFSENVTLSSTNAPANSNITFSPTTINSNGELTVTVANLDNVAVGDYTIKVTGTGTSINKSVDLILSVNDNHCKSTGNTVSQISTTLVNFGSIDNTSTKTTGYSDYKSISTEVIKGDKYLLKTNVNTDGNNTVKTYAWIDWNQNCLFDANEKYDLGQATNTSGATSNSGLEITIPNDALTGSTTLRVSTKNADAGDPNSCELDFNGEVEDYTITITPSFTLTNKTESLSICNKAVSQVEYKLNYKIINSFNENVTLSSTNVPANANITFSPSTINSNGEVTVSVANLDNVAVGDYTIKVTGTSTSMTKSVDLILSVNDNHCKSSGNTTSQISTTLVNFGSIDNTSTKTTGYSDYKSMSTEVIKGDKYLLKTNVNTDGNNTVKTYAWIDWNQNCLFDANEKYDLGQATNTSGATSNSGLEITVPSDALTGSTTLRVSTKNTNAGDPNSCELDFNGEVEDYTITITPSFTLTNKTGGGSVCNKGTSEFVYNINYEVFNDFNENVALSVTSAPTGATATLSASSINANNVFTLTVSGLNNVAVGDYTLKLTGTGTSLTKSVNIILSVNDNICKSSGNTRSQISITNVKFGEIDNASTKTNGYSDFKSISSEVVRGENYSLNVTINKDGNADVITSAWIDWNQNCLFDADETFDLTSNTSAITVPENAITGSTTLRVSTKLKTTPNSCELDFDGEVEDYTINVVESFATDATLFNDLKMYPVPSDGKLTIDFKVKSKDLTIVRLFDLRGQLIETQNFSTVSSSFNKEIQFTKVSSGIYLIQLENAGKLKTRKIIIK